MNIAMVGQKGIPAISGGIEKHVEEIAVRLSDMGHEVMVFTRSRYIQNTKDSYRGVMLKQVPHLKSKHLDAISHAFSSTLYVIFNRTINLVHYHAIGPCLMLPMLRLFRPGLRVVATHHSRDYLHGKWNAMAMAMLRLGEWSMCRFAHEVIAVSRTNQHYLEEKYQRQILFIPNGTSIPRHESRPLPQDHPLERDGFFLVVARLIPVKCIDDIIAAYQQLDTDKFLVIAGESSHTDQYAVKVRAMAESNEKILFIGHQTPEQLAILYSNAYLYINASSVEGLSIAVLEAMSYGCATLVSDIDGNLEAVGEQGLTFHQGDVSALRQKLDDLLSDHSFVEANSKYCVERIRQNFNWDEIIKTIDNLYRESESWQMGSLRHIIDRILHHDKWAVGFVQLDPAQLVQGVLTPPVKWIAPRFGQFIADPFIFTHNDTDYLLYELFTYADGYGKNVIAEVVKDESGQYRLHNEQIIIDEPFHQSYPFVFSFKETIYCLPEQAESNSLRLYRATDFPSTWVLDGVLIDDSPVIDPTIFQHNGRWWLLATMWHGQQDSHLYAWYSEELHGPWRPHDQNPIKTGLGTVRPAGPVFTVGNHLYRPVQGFLKRYGDGGLLIEKILELTPSTFREETVVHIKPFSEYPRGLHHVCMGKNLAVVDGNRFAGPLEIVLKRLGILRKKLAKSKG